MPDDPIDKNSGNTPNPEDKLRELFDKIEREVQTPSGSEEPLQTSDDIPLNVQKPVDSDISFESFAHGSHEEDTREDEELTEEERQLREFDKKLKAARAGSMPEPPEWNYQRPKMSGKNKVEENNYLGMGIGISIAYTLVGCTLAGWGIGKLIDMPSGGYLGQAIGTLVGAVVGLAAAIFTIVRAQNKPGQ